jgi:hypothetical protein
LDDPAEREERESRLREKMTVEIKRERLFRILYFFNDD